MILKNKDNSEKWKERNKKDTKKKEEENENEKKKRKKEAIDSNKIQSSQNHIEDKNIIKKGVRTNSITNNKIGSRSSSHVSKTNYVNNKINYNSKNTTNKKHYLDDVDKTIMKKDANCINYAYQNLNESKNQKKDVKSLMEHIPVLDILSLEKKKKTTKKKYTYEGNKAKEDENIQSLIYETFRNKNLKIPTSSSIEPKKVKTTKRKGSNTLTKTIIKKNNEMKINKKPPKDEFYEYKQTLTEQNQIYLTTEVEEKEYKDTSIQAIEPNETQNDNNASIGINEDLFKKKKRTENVSIGTQTELTLEEEINCVAKVTMKRIINEAFIQISYEQNLKQIEEKTKSIQINNELNKQIFNKLSKSQKNNLESMKEENKITQFLAITNKINHFGISKNLIQQLIQQNMNFMLKKEEYSGVKKIKHQNEITKSILKNTTGFLRTEKVVSFITEEIIEESFLNFCLFDEKDINRINDNLNQRKNYLHQKNKIEKGFFNFILSYDNETTRIPLKISESLNLQNVLDKIKKYLKSNLGFLKDEYNLDSLVIKNKDHSIKDVKELYLSEPNQLKIFVKKKKKKKEKRKKKKK